jgi:hypothetical protein
MPGVRTGWITPSTCTTTTTWVPALRFASNSRAPDPPVPHHRSSEARRRSTVDARPAASGSVSAEQIGSWRGSCGGRRRGRRELSAGLLADAEAAAASAAAAAPRTGVLRRGRRRPQGLRQRQMALPLRVACRMTCVPATAAMLRPRQAGLAIRATTNGILKVKTIRLLHMRRWRSSSSNSASTTEGIKLARSR